MSTLSKAVAAGALTAALALQVGALAGLSYSTSWLVRVDESEVAAAPSPDFRIGSVDWNVGGMRERAGLEPFRSSYLSECDPAASPVDAALCVSNRMARQFTDGEPPSEFVASSFDPTAHLVRHSAGEPGHCVTRSAILAAELLSLGVPARLVQLAPLDHSVGHNLVEVWEEQLGWVLVDPTYGGLVGTSGGPASALALLDTTEIRWFPDGVASSAYVSLSSADVEAEYARLQRSAILYPEPWLYLRDGGKRAPWPYRGTYLQTGNSTFTLGPAHRLLRVSVPATLLAAAAAWLSLLLRVVSSKSTSRTPAEAAASR